MPLLHRHSHDFDLRHQLRILGSHAWTRPPGKGASLPKPRVFHNQIVFNISLFLYLDLLQMARPVSRSVEWTATSPKYQRQKTERNWVVFTPLQALNETSSQRRLHTTLPERIFWASLATKFFSRRLSYRCNRSIQSCKLLKYTTPEQSISARTFCPTGLYNLTRPFQSTYPR